MSSSTHFNDLHHGKRDSTSCNSNAILCPPPLKVSRDSHLIKKSSSSTSYSASASAATVTGPTKPPQQRHPVIIYTHSPKVIHTQPKDFMALVQKLTGLSRNADDQPQQNCTHQRQQLPPPPLKAENGGRCTSFAVAEEDNRRVTVGCNDDNESSSVITCLSSSSVLTDENCDGGAVANSCLAAQIIDPLPAPFLPNLPVFTPNTTEFLCMNQPYYSFADSFFYPPNMRNSVSTSSILNGMNEFDEY